MDSFVDRATNEQNIRFADKCIDFFAKCNIPFAVVEDESFHALIQELRPCIKIPNRKEMSGKLLDKCFESTIAFNRSLVQGQRHGTLFADGWKNMSNNKKNLVTSMRAGKRNVMIKSFDATRASETGQYILDAVKEAQKLAKEVYGVTCNAVVTDKAPNMVLMGKIMAGEIQADLDELEEEDEEDEDLEDNKKGSGDGLSWYVPFKMPCTHRKSCVESYWKAHKCDIPY